LNIIRNRENYIIILLKLSRSLLFRILWALRNFSLKLYLSLVARLNYYLKIPITTRSVDVVSIGHRHNINRIIPNTWSSNLPPISPVIYNGNNDELRESLVDTSLSILKMLLLCFIILLLFGRVNSPSAR